MSANWDLEPAGRPGWRALAPRAAAALGGLLAIGLAATLVAASAAVVLLAPATKAIAAGTTGCAYADLPPLTCLLHQPPTRSVVYAADGSVLAYLHGDQDRVVVPLSAVPPTVRDAVLAAEDARFYQHGALDARGIARALATNLRDGGVREGGSSIAQQYVKNVVTGDQVSLRRKLTEAVYATRLERYMTKDQLLAAYLNLVYFGDGVYGIATAAEHYFSKPVGRLSLAEAAALAGTIARPTTYRPTGGASALRRRNEVLQRMAAAGFATPAQVTTAAKQPLSPRVRPETVRSPYFVDYVTRQLLGSHAYDATLGPAGSAAREQAVFEGGLSIATTLRPGDQALAQAAVRHRLAGVGRAGALVSIAPASGAIVAMVGGRDYAHAKVNLATGQGGDGFPPGSSFKVFYLVAALEQGITAGLTLDAPASVTVRAPECPAGYTVHNAETGGLGRIDLARATAESVNTYYAQLMVQVGSPAAIRVARRMGISTPLHDYCSLVLGSENVTPIDLAGAYATLADGGIHCQPLAIARITDPSGRVIDDGTPSCRRVVDRGVADAATGILRGVVAPGGTGFRAAIGRPLAGKTGTTTRYTNAWFTGFTPQLATSVWVGDPDRQAPMTDLFGGGPVYGGTYPALIFRDYMAAALANRRVLDLPGPPGTIPPSGPALAIRAPAPAATGRTGWRLRRHRRRR